MKLAFTVVVPTLASALVFGATHRASAEPRHALQGSVDLGVQSVRDDNLVPLAHSGPRLAFAARYFGAFGSELLLAEGRLGTAIVFGRYGEQGLTLSWGLQAAPLFAVHESARGAWFVGPTLALDNETFFFADWDDAHAYWIGTRWVGPRVHGYRFLGGPWRVDFDGQLALFGALSRPPAYRRSKQETSPRIGPFLTWPLDDPAFAWLADFQLVRLGVDFYRTRVRARVPSGFGLGLELAFTRAVEPAPAFSVETTLRLSHSWGI
jgi:hypothetical protein